MTTPAGAPPLLDWQYLDTQLGLGLPPLKLFKAALNEASAALAELFRRQVAVADLVIQRAEVIDQILRRAWSYYLSQGKLSQGNLSQGKLSQGKLLEGKPAERKLADGMDAIALIAVGGYGRGELHPASDIDVLILLPEHTALDYAGAIERFLLLLWDMGLDIGHSVRTVADCVQQAEQDITVATNLMEARLIIGPQPLYDQLMDLTGPQRIWPGNAFFQAKLAEQKQRHLRFGDTAYNLEPNIKENPGGLRDLQTIGWVVKRHFGATTLIDLVRHEFIIQAEYDALIHSQNFLWRIRFALHLLAGRREDRLLFNFQRQIAEQFGYQDRDHRLAVEFFMKDYYRTVMELTRLNEMLLQLFDEAILHGGEPVPCTVLNKRFQACNGYLEVTHNRIFIQYPFALLEMFLILEQHRELRGIRAATIRLIRQSLPLIDEKFRNDVRNRSLFMEIFRQPEGLTHELRRMNRYGVLAAYLPPFGNIVGQMQHDMFHVYTVDEHTLFLIRNLRRFTVEAHTEEFPLCSEIIRQIPKPELLYLAGLFHDIAKGRGGDHSQLGAKDAGDFCRRHGLSNYDSNLVAWLVSHHLIMSSTAQRKDISAPDTIYDFASVVSNQDRLNYLFLLTVADIRATNPQLWNSWKEALLTELYYSTTRALRRGLDQPEQQQDRIDDTRNTALKGLLEQDYTEAAVLKTWEGTPDEYFFRFSADEIIWHTQARLEVRDLALPLIRVRKRPRFGRSELMVLSPISEQTFAKVTETIDRLQLSITDARIIPLQEGLSLETFILLERDGSNISENQRLQDIPVKIQQALSGETRQATGSTALSHVSNRKAKHFPIPPEITFMSDPTHNCTVMELIVKDQPGLLAKVSRILLESGLQIKNAKIATFGARAEDIFYIEDKHGNAIADDSSLLNLKAALEATLG